MMWTPLQRRALEAMGYAVMQARGTRGAATPLAEAGLPPGLRRGLERWVGALWGEWPKPAGHPGDAAFKRALWCRIREWRRGG